MSEKLTIKRIFSVSVDFTNTSASKWELKTFDLPCKIDASKSFALIPYWRVYSVNHGGGCQIDSLTDIAITLQIINAIVLQVIIIELK